jgi:hypothetical protein
VLHSRNCGLIPGNGKRVGTSCLVGSGGCFPGHNVARALADHFPPSGAMVMNEYSCTSTPPYVIMVCTIITLPLRG